MFSLTDIKQAVDNLTDEERAELRAYLDKQQQDLTQEIDMILETAPSPQLMPGTMDPDRLEDAISGMWAGLDEDETDVIVQAMNEEYIEMEDGADE